MTSRREDLLIYLDLSLVTCQQQHLLLMRDTPNLIPNLGSVAASSFHVSPLPFIFTPSTKLLNSA